MIPWLSFRRLRLFKPGRKEALLQTRVMSRATEKIATQSRLVVDLSVKKKLTQFNLFTPLFDWKKQLCNGKIYKKYEKRAFRL